MSLTAEVISRFKSAMQFSGPVQASVNALGTRLDTVEADVKDIERDLKAHGERIARLEAAGETLEERTMLYLERAIARATRGNDPLLAPYPPACSS
jgi:septal ring factor EnvC (AmiA/AmiB activator)